MSIMTMEMREGYNRPLNINSILNIDMRNFLGWMKKKNEKFIYELRRKKNQLGDHKKKHSIFKKICMSHVDSSRTTIPHVREALTSQKHDFLLFKKEFKDMQCGGNAGYHNSCAPGRSCVFSTNNSAF
ncbi:hypothetical protein DM860_011992 [Cuscuta australis]|uniref:Uncharacterized protein n=1 Tax=Cuscuta australis TaxID=267555 RepID=A0A328DDD1_9ASTE|nr:hypothetical protein DM860_011992 [Cuscuta australis]